MNIAGLQKLTTKDFPGILACIVFTKGCNLKCPYCQNSELIPLVGPVTENSLTSEDVIEFLKQRKNVLDGIVITGGEPLLQVDIKDFLKSVKEVGYKIKLDTNGTTPSLLKELIDSSLIDYVAMDIKNDFEGFGKTCGVNNINTNNIVQSIEILKASPIDYEFRTTIVKEFHNQDSILNICKMIGKEPKYFLQNFEDSSNVMNHDLHGFTTEELQEIQKHFEREYSNLKVRGLN